VLRLDSHISLQNGADGARIAHAAYTDIADDDVDTLARHVESYLDVEGLRRHGPHAVAARLLHAAAFPSGRAFLDERVPDENRKIRKALQLLRAPENAGTLASIRLPLEWLDLLETAIDVSESAYFGRTLARAGRKEQVALGKEAEAQWLDVVTRLRKYVESRAPAGHTQKELEGRALIAPLTEALQHARAMAAARATRRAQSAVEVAPESATE